ERDLVRICVAAARAREHAHADALAHVPRRLLDDAVLEGRRLHAGQLEVAIGPVGAPLERSPEHVLERAPGQAEALEDESIGTCGLESQPREQRGLPVPTLRHQGWTRMERRAILPATRWHPPRVAG